MEKLSSGHKTRKNTQPFLLELLGYIMPNNKVGGETALPINRKPA